VAAFVDILDYALKEAAGEDRVRAVHEFRKSVRRARALLALCEDLLPPRDRRQLGKLLRNAMRPTSRLRDQDVMPEVLDALKVSDDLKSAVKSVQAELTHRSAAEEEVREALRTGRACVEEAEAIFKRSLADPVDWDDMESGIRQSYTRARRALKQAIKTGESDHVHDWRKRTKELGYQVELLGRGDYAVTRRKQFAKLATSLGEITDRVELVAHLRAAGFSGGKRKKLAKSVIAELRAKARRAFSKGELIYGQKGKDFAAELIRAARSSP
jgi:CHAD domain-containing protein